MGAVNQSDLATQVLQSHAGQVPYQGRYVEAVMPQQAARRCSLGHSARWWFPRWHPCRAWHRGRTSHTLDPLLPV